MTTGYTDILYATGQIIFYHYQTHRNIKSIKTTSMEMLVQEYLKT